MLYCLCAEDTKTPLLKCAYVFDFQIVNDRAVGGKCYGFVTFTNPRSAINAISDMDGKVSLSLLLKYTFLALLLVTRKESSIILVQEE